MIYFEWDEKKESRNLRVHGISFNTASLVFEDPFRLTEDDSVVEGERRLRTTGLIGGTLVLIVIHLELDDDDDIFVRIMSARKATAAERKLYEQNHQTKAG